MNTPRNLLGWFAVALLPFLVGSVPAEDVEQISAQDELAGSEGAAYGRFRWLEGDTSVRRGTEILYDLEINDPIVPGDVVVTGPDSRSDIQLADGSIVRLDESTEAVFQSLADGTNQIENTTILQVGSGSVIVRAEQMDSNEKRFQIDTDSASVFLLSDGIFRINVRRGGETTVLSRRGVAEVMSQDVSAVVRSGERIAVGRGQIPGEPQAFNTRISDSFDAWSAQRDDELLGRQRVDQQTPPGLPDPVEPYVNELSYYGQWHQNPSYGWVWRPVGLAGGWQPYLNGRWVASPAGLVWVSLEPWGWAPFHYGRWEFLLGTGWVWIPGQVFSGAYVAWSVSPGYFGWCPLGYYNYPISYHVSLGFHRSPWVHVRDCDLYHHGVNRVVIRNEVIVREIEKRQVVVRGIPVMDARKLKNSPRVTEELHRAAVGRELQVIDSTQPRRVPFHEKERSGQVKQNAQRVRGRAPGAIPVGQGVSGRPVKVLRTGTDVAVPKPKQSPRVSVPSTTAPRNVTPGASAPRNVAPRTVTPRTVDPRTSTPRTVAPRTVDPRTSTPRTVAPRTVDPRTSTPRAAGPYRKPTAVDSGSGPERMIPRIIPRPRPTQSQGSSRATAPRTGPPKQNGPAQARPGSQPRPSQPQGSSSAPQGNGGSKGGGAQKGKSDKGGNGRNRH